MKESSVPQKYLIIYGTKRIGMSNYSLQIMYELERVIERAKR
jgi:hypothetical protein